MKNTGMARVSMGVLLLVTVGCGSSDDGSAPAAAGGSAGQSGAAGASSGGAAGAAGTAGTSAGAAGSGGNADPGVTLSGTVVEFGTNGPPPPLEGASVCVVARADIPCVLSDAAGAFELPGAPRGVETGFVVSKAGYLSVARLGRNSSAPTTMKVGVTSLASLATAQAFATAAGFTYPTAGTSLVYVAAATPGSNGYEGLAGATISLTVPFAKGPVYVQEGGAPDPKATATTTDGGAYFSGVSPGPFEAVVMAPGKLCSNAVGGWASATTGHLAGVALADTLTTISISCE